MLAQWRIVFLTALIFFVALPGQPQETKSRLLIQDIETLLKGGVTQARVANLISERGVTFEVTDEIRGRLKKAGAGAAVMQAIEKAGLDFARANLDEERRKIEWEQKKIEEDKQRENERRRVEVERAKAEAERSRRETEERDQATKRKVEEENRPYVSVAARKEGKVVWYTSLALPSSAKLANLFTEKHKEIKVEVVRDGSQQVLKRVMQEAAAGIKNADIIHTSDVGHFAFLKSKGMLMRSVPKGVEAFPRGFIDKDGFYYGMRATLSVLAHNPQIVSEKEAPKTWKDLLDPKWKGKMVTAHPGYSGIIMTHMLALLNLYGWDYFNVLAGNRLHVVQSANDPAEVVTSGERPIAVNGAEYFYYRTRKQGNPLSIVYPKDGVPLVISPIAILKDSPRPSAARLFMDFVFTRQAQQAVADMENLYTGHPEVTYPHDKPRVSGLNLLAIDAQELEDRNAELKKKFTDLFGG